MIQSNLIVAALLVISATSCRQRATDRQHGPQILFEDTIIDLGSFPLNEEKHFVYRFNNAGDSGLVIEGADPDCSACTTIDYPSDTIPPGQSGEICVTFDGTGRYLAGPHEFYIHIKTNTLKEYTDLLFTTDFILE